MIEWLKGHWPIALAGSIFAVVLVLIGLEVRNEVREPKSGTVTEKRYHPAYTTNYCAAYNAKGTCIAWGVQYHPERYEVIYQNRGESGDADVSPVDYDRIQVGHKFPEES